MANVDDPLEIGVGQGGDRREWVESHQKKDFRFEDISHPGDDALIEEDVGDRLVAAGPDAANGLGTIERFAEEVGAERAGLCGEDPAGDALR